jgi:hypothetical protein
LEHVTLGTWQRIKTHSVVVMMGEAVKRGLEYWRFVITNEAGSQIAVVPFARKKGARKLKKSRSPRRRRV